MTFDDAFERTVGIEGGYVCDQNDPGGETKFGISKRSYPDLDIKNLTREQARDIYFRDFWQTGHMGEFDEAISYQVFGFAVNSGIQTAIRKLQAAVGVADDGWIGPMTVKAVKDMTVSDVIMRYVAQRLRFWTALSTWQLYGKGWTRRAASDLEYGAQDT